ncbi:unnamed protein product [Closterium sp. NIES-54]
MNISTIFLSALHPVRGYGGVRVGERTAGDAARGGGGWVEDGPRGVGAVDGEEQQQGEMKGKQRAGCAEPRVAIRSSSHRKRVRCSDLKKSSGNDKDPVGSRSSVLRSYLPSLILPLVSTSSVVTAPSTEPSAISPVASRSSPPVAPSPSPPVASRPFSPPVPPVASRPPVPPLPCPVALSRRPVPSPCPLAGSRQAAAGSKQ